MTQNKAHKTAISRKKPSVPMQWLCENGLLSGYLQLDYGCGKGKDADTYNMDKYDPYYTDGQIISWVNGDTIPVGAKQYDLITCNYVLNVIESEAEREKVLSDIRGLLLDGGVAYISVRRDPQVAEGCTKTGTYQSAVELDLPVVIERKGKFIIYKLEK